MALTTPTDRNMLNVVGQYEREVAGKPLTVAQLSRIAETAKRMVLDELQSVKAAAAR